MDALIFAQTNLVEAVGESVPFLKTRFLDVELWRYAAALGVLMVGLAVKRLIEVFVVRRLMNLFSKTAFKYDEMVVGAVGKPASAFVIVGCIYLATQILADGLALDPFWRALITKAYLVGVGVVVLWAAYRLVDVIAAWLDDLAAGEDSGVKGQFIPLIKQSLRLFTLIVGGLTILATLEVDVVGLLAGLGVGGIAIALAAQDAVGNFIGTVSIFADRPFKVGDWIIVGDKVDGNVEQIGFRSTKVRTWPKTLMSIPNKVLATEIVDNWSQMPKRRIKMTVGVTYSTTPDQMEELLRRIKEILKNDKGVDQDFFIVRFTEFGASSLDVFLYYFTKSIKWDEHLAVRERMNLNIMRTINELGLSIAFPTRSIHVESMPPAPVPPGQSDAGG